MGGEIVHTASTVQPHIRLFSSCLPMNVTSNIFVNFITVAIHDLYSCLQLERGALYLER